ncbi:hypothetical protein Pisl_1040 [Pyrobaculum islandicum DSM 4184]|uniref:Uncharacterized protein n=1 Tax=Pyrobaculum islandicum (strain DSM 4184 / JCM 9189 / GEO3) TaxID=384616 RepID=A1RTD2_PYRIL|nr:hypothetical protein [Pyrobaculum islandicum]ABL88214.1 hypothetical protein Pisl_1040 [Pyrobaculum islandicum DSM 4184]
MPVDYALEVIEEPVKYTVFDDYGHYDEDVDSLLPITATTGNTTLKFYLGYTETTPGEVRAATVETAVLRLKSRLLTKLVKKFIKIETSYGKTVLEKPIGGKRAYAGTVLEFLKHP